MSLWAAAGAGGGTANAQVSTVAGVVRDAQGVAQMGALVQVLGANATTVATAFTDAHGRYVIHNLTPGRYLLRASEALFVPASRNNLELRRGTTSVIDLTLAALFDTTSWLPAQRRRADEPEDDWKWTLRSPANRPILRMVEDGSAIEVSSSAEQGGQVARAKAREAVTSGDGEFGRGGLHDVLTVRQLTADGGEMMLRTDLGAGTGRSGAVQTGDFDAGYQHGGAQGDGVRTLVSYRSHPEMVTAGSPDGLQVLEMTGSQRTMLGESIELETGGSLEAIRTDQTLLATHPFVRVTGHPFGSWTVQYRMATDRELQGFDDVVPGEREMPVALVRNGRLALERGRHQEASVARRSGRRTVAVAYYHDALDAAAVSGGLAASESSRSGVLKPANDMLVDPLTGSFRVLTSGFKTDGVRLTASTPLTTALWVAAEYSSGAAIESSTGSDASATEAMAGLHQRRSQAVTLALKGKLVGAGTRIRASYRWQPASLVTAVDSYSSFGDQAFFSCLLRQPIRWGKRLPTGLDATIDVTNLLAEGYRPFVSADGQTLYFAASPRTIQAGLSFSF